MRNILTIIIIKITPKHAGKHLNMRSSVVVQQDTRFGLDTSLKSI